MALVIIWFDNGYVGNYVMALGGIIRAVSVVICWVKVSSIWKLF